MTRANRLARRVDVEGYEMSVLEGGKRLLANNRGYAQIEALEPDAKQAVTARMRELGWQFVAVINEDLIFEKVT